MVRMKQGDGAGIYESRESEGIGRYDMFNYRSVYMASVCVGRDIQRHAIAPN